MSETSKQQKAERDAKAAKGRVEKVRYEAIKSHVYEWESHNYDKLILFKSRGEGGWYKMGGNSAIIYHYEIAPKLGRKSNLNIDLDYFSKFSNGVVSIRGIETLTKELETIGVKMIENKNDDVIIFKLKTRLSKQQIEVLLGIEEEKIKQINRLVLPKGPTNPDLYRQLRDLLKRLCELCRKAGAPDRDIFMTEMARRSKLMMEGYFALAQGRKDVGKVKKELVAHAEILLVDMQMISDLRIISPNDGARLSAILVKIERLVEKMK